MIFTRKASILWKSSCILVLICLALSFLLADVLRLKDIEAKSLGIPAPTKFLSVAANYDMPILKGLQLDPKNPLKLNFILDNGDFKKVEADDISLLVSYFLAAITVPQEDLWVNLSPYEGDRIITESLGITDMGRDLLVQDYVLKQLSSSLTHPDSQTGQEYWKRIKDGNAYNKIWISPDEVEVLEYQCSVLITQASFKLQTEADYLAAKQNLTHTSELSALTIILPQLEQQVNEGRHFSRLRQIYNSIILGLWFKEKFRRTFFKAYIDQSKINGIDIKDKSVKERIYKKYLEAFKKGVYDISKTKRTDKQNLKMRYFSGGISSAIDIDSNTVNVGANEFSDAIRQLPKEQTSLFSVKLTDFWADTKKTVLTVLMSGLILFANAGFYNIYHDNPEALNDLVNTLAYDDVLASKGVDITLDYMKESIENTQAQKRHLDKVLDYLVSEGHPKQIHDVPIVMLSGLEYQNFALYNPNHKVVVLPDLDLSEMDVREGAILLGHELIHALDTLSQSNIESEVKAFRETWRRVVALRGDDSYEAKVQYNIYKGMERLLADSVFVKEALGVEAFSAVNYSGVKSEEGLMTATLFELGTDNAVDMTVNLKTNEISIINEEDINNAVEIIVNHIQAMDVDELNENVGTRLGEGDKVEFTVVDILGNGEAIIVKFSELEQLYKAVIDQIDDKMHVQFVPVVQRRSSSSAINGGIDLQDTKINVSESSSTIELNHDNLDLDNFKGFSFEILNYVKIKSFEQIDKLIYNRGLDVL